MAADPNDTRPSTLRRSLAGLLVIALVAVGLGVAALIVALRNDNNDSGGGSASGGSGSDASGGTSNSCDVSKVADRELPSVVTIETQHANGSGGNGSGEVIDDKGHILTNNHVISTAAIGGGSVSVVFSNGDRQDAELVGRDPQTDLAVLSVKDHKDLRPMAFGKSDDVRVGQPVVALGAPLGLSSTVTSGIVSARDRSVNVPSDHGKTALLVAAIQTDAAINPGNSGGALVDCTGALVGVPTAGATVPSPEGAASGGSIGLGFAIPSDFAKTIADDLIKNGKVTHGYFGVNVSTVGNGEQVALFVTGVTAGGPAADAGLQEGDVITKVDGQAATGAEQLQSLSLTKRPGDKVKVTFDRGGSSHEATITMGSSSS